ncbi:MAG: amidohydrolase family protein [Anaerolineales bacterium]
MSQSIDTLIIGGVVLTMDTAFTIHAPGAVAIQGDSIIDVGPAAELQNRYTAAETLDASGQVVMPGFVNAHTHIPMTLLRGMADDLRLEVWLMGYVMPTESHFVSADFCRLGTQLACVEMIRAGTTTFADMYYHEQVVAETAAEAGLRGVCGQTILKFPAPDFESWQDALAYTEEFMQAYADHPLIVPAVAPHAPYTVTDEMLEACAALAKKYDKPLHIHIAETAYEVENSLNEYDLTVLRRVDKLGVLEAKCICAHCVHIDSGEIRLAAHKGAGIAHNPSSNLKLASGIAPVVEMLEQGCKVGIGTDGPASNNDLDMLQETHIASLIAKVQASDPTALPARDALLLATRLGAAALHLDHLTGSLAAGKRADLIIIDTNGPHSSPHFDHDPNNIYGRIVYATKSTDIQHVMVNGRWLMRDQSLLTLDDSAILAQARQTAAEIDAFIRGRAEDHLTKLISIGGVAQEQSFELQSKARIADAAIVEAFLNSDEVDVLHKRFYTQYDVYFVFPGGQARIRHREDDIKDAAGKTLEVRSRLTYTGPDSEALFGDAVVLSRSRFIAPATYPLRFYREYFVPPREVEVQKNRRRWRVLYRGVEFYVNYDELMTPAAGQTFLEIKTRTWSRQDAEAKAALLQTILTDELKLKPDQFERREYVDLALEDEKV